MTKVKTTSSMMNSVSHDSDSKILEVEFKNGRIVRHEGVSEREFLELTRAESVGKHYNAYIRGVKKTTE